MLGTNTGLISVDQEKAFDHIRHNFLWKVMEKFRYSLAFKAKVVTSNSLHLLKDPLIHQARLDICGDVMPGMMVELYKDSGKTMPTAAGGSSRAGNE